MSSLSETSGNAAAIERIQALSADKPPLWGKMDCAQMLAHCQKPFQLALGELKIKRGLIGKLLGGWAKKKFIVSENPFGKNSPTDPQFRMAGEFDFERERAGLIALVKRYGAEGAQSDDPHPFFGPLSAGEWDRLMWKHIDHHLRQFGV